MTEPKEAHWWQLVMIARRTAQRQFFWRPGRDTRELFGYMFVKACLDQGLEAIAASLMSNHIHAMLLDLCGRRSEWMQQAFSNTARKRNLDLNRRENLWRPGEPGDMPILDMEKVVEQVLYVALQPVAAGLVEKADEWTGFKILPSDWGKPMRFARPSWCGSGMPEFVELTPLPPPGFRHLPLPDVIAFFEAKIAEREAYYRRKRKGRPVAGIALCEARNPFSTPDTPAPMRTRNPRFTTSDPELRQRAIKRLQEFSKWHREALNDFRDGDREVEFPAGTIQMARRAGCCCAVAAGDHPLSLRLTWSHALQSSWDTWLARR